MSFNELRLAYIESAKDVSKPGTPTRDGILTLTRSVDVFFISWTKADATQTHLLNGIMQSPLAFSDIWEPGEQFCIDCTKFQALELKQDSFTLTFTRRDEGATRSFCFVSLPSIASFLEQLILNGIAVVNGESGFSLEFYARCHRGVCPFCPSDIRLECAAIKDLDSLWESLMDLNEKLILYLRDKRCLPQDPTFPLAPVARTLNNRVVARIRAALPKLEKRKQKLLDKNGEIADKEHFRENVYLNGVLPEELPALLPFIVGLYDVNARKDEIAAKEAELAKEFRSLYKQTKLIKKQQVARNEKISSAFRVISHDVLRTDRGTKAFSNENGIGLKMVTDLLHTYILFNMPVGYLQGMNDLFVPLLLAFFDDWNDESSPVDKQGKVVDYEAVMPNIFWCFDALLWNINHFNMLRSVTDSCRDIAAQALTIVDQVSPTVVVWLRKSNLQELLWLYSDFVLLFKRSYEDVWDIWCAINCFDMPSRAIAYFVAAILVLTFESVTRLPETSVTDLMNAFPVFLETLSLLELAQFAQYFCQKAPIPPAVAVPENVEFGKFEFFAPDWLT